MIIANLNCHFLFLEQAQICPLVRSLLLDDGVYEVIPVYQGRVFRSDAHIQRLENRLVPAGIAKPLSSKEWSEVLCELLNGNGGGDQSIHLPVTREMALRKHHFLVLTSAPVVSLTRTPRSPFDRHGGRHHLAVHREFRRARKSIALMASAIPRQEAVEMGATVAIH